MVNNPTSLTLLEKARNHDQEAWNRLFYLYTPLVRCWCQQWGLNPADTDDLSQEVFQGVMRGLDTFHRDQPGDTFRGWLKMISRRKFLDTLRQRERHPPAAGGTDAYQQLLQIPENDPTPEPDSADEVKRLYHRALELIRTQFEERSWQAFWGSAVEGRSPESVGAELGMTSVAVRKAKSRVLQRLKVEFRDLLG